MNLLSVSFIYFFGFASSIHLVSNNANGSATVNISGEVYSSHRFSHNIDYKGENSLDGCAFFPHKKRIVLVNLDMDYIENQMFKNWLHFALPFLQDSQLAIDAPDKEVRTYLHTRVKNLPESTYLIDENFVDNTIIKSMALNKHKKRRDPFNSDGFFDMMRRRPHIIEKFLRRGCEVLQVDLDTAWSKDVFKDIESAGKHELYVTDDNCNRKNPESWYFCGCFVYFKPLRNWTSFINDWIHFTGHRGNEQDGLNKALRERYKTDNAIDFAILPFEIFPPGCYSKTHSLPNASTFHANYLRDRRKKVNFLKDRNLWNPE